MEDRPHLLLLLNALNASDTQLRRDECGDYRIKGKRGHIYLDGDGYLIVLGEQSGARRWTNIKRNLSFCRVTQDGDDEGCLHLSRLPTEEEAAEIRDAIGLRKRSEYSPEGLEAKRVIISKVNAR